MRSYSKFLPLLGLLILFCPFFQTCSDRQIIEEPILRANPINEFTRHDDSTSVVSRSDMEKMIYRFIDAKEEMTLNGYEYIWIGLNKFDGISVNDLNHSAALLLLSIIIILSIFFFLIIHKNKVARNLSILGCAITIIMLATFVYQADDVAQIKIGQYLYCIHFITMSALLIRKIKIDATSHNSGSRAMAGLR